MLTNRHQLVRALTDSGRSDAAALLPVIQPLNREDRHTLDEPVRFPGRPDNAFITCFDWAPEKMADFWTDVYTILFEDYGKAVEMPVENIEPLPLMEGYTSIGIDLAKGDSCSPELT